MIDGLDSFPKARKDATILEEFLNDIDRYSEKSPGTVFLYLTSDDEGTVNRINRVRKGAMTM